MKKLFKGLLVVVGVMVSLLVGLIAMGDKIEAWAYDKYGKEKVRDYMKKFEPYIVLSDDEDEVEEGEADDAETLEDATDEVADMVEEVNTEINEVVEEVQEEVLTEDDENLE